MLATNVAWLAVAALLSTASLSHAQEGSDLAKAAQNPIGSMISLPFESSFNFENGTEDDDLQYVLSVQPVIPLSIAEKWNLITRPIIPLISQPKEARLPSPPVVTRSDDRTFGLGDINLSLFFSPKSSSGGFVWGAGPVTILPTASDDALGSEKWSLGPTGVVVYQTGPWLLGALVGQVWSVTGASSRDDVNSGYLQPFVNYNLAKGWYLSTSPMMTANWQASSGETFTIPVGGGVGKILSIGSQRINTRLVAYYSPERPSRTADWSLQWTLQFLFPK